MKNTSKFLAIALLAGALASPTLTTKPAHAATGPFEQAGSFTGLGNMSCGGMFRRAKARAKDTAKRYCRQNYGSGGRAITSTKWFKGTCNKSNVSAEGTLRFFCR